VESYPHAAWKSLGLKPLPSKRRTRVSDLAEAFGALRSLIPLTASRPPNHDQLQAIVGGLRDWRSKSGTQQRRALWAIRLDGRHGHGGGIHCASVATGAAAESGMAEQHELARLTTCGGRPLTIRSHKVCVFPGPQLRGIRGTRFSLAWRFEVSHPCAGKRARMGHPVQEFVLCHALA